MDDDKVRAVAERTQAAPLLRDFKGSNEDALRLALLVLYDDTADYIQRNNLGSMDNHAMRLAREALALSSTAPPQAQPKPASDHSKATQPIWSAMLGPCICKFCNALRAGEQAEAAPVEPDNETLLKLARRCLWIAFVWNDHNFKAAHTYAKREAEECGIDSFDAANVWIAQAPKPEQPTSAAASDQQVDAITGDIDSGFRQEEHVAMLRAVFRAGRRQRAPKAPTPEEHPMSDGAEATRPDDPRENCSRWDGERCWNPIEGSECQCVRGVRAVAERTQAAPPKTVEIADGLNYFAAYTMTPDTPMQVAAALAVAELRRLSASPTVAPAPEPTPQQAEAAPELPRLTDQPVGHPVSENSPSVTGKEPT